MTPQDVLQKVNEEFPSQKFCDTRHEALEKSIEKIDSRFWAIIILVVGNILAVIGARLL
jgi:hypothetical protein